MKKHFPFKYLILDFINFVIVFGIVVGISFYFFTNFAKNNPNNETVRKINYFVESLLENSHYPKNSLVQNDSNPSSNSPPNKTQNANQNTVQIVKQTLPSVISINTINRSENKINAGTGYVATNDGYIITNKHVIATACKYGMANMQIIGVGSDGAGYDLEIKSIDPIDDIAILKIKNFNQNTTLKKINFGDSSKLELGEEVVAIGNALGTLQNTVTKGIISGLGRSFQTSDLKDECTNSDSQTDNLIQTDAAINKGNSGGPLFDISGKMIAMNTLGTSDAQNVGLAIPSNTIVKVLDGFLQKSEIVRPRLGVITEPINYSSKLQNPWLPVEYGEFVGSLDNTVPENKAVSGDSSADIVGLRAGDIILEVDSQKMIFQQGNPSPLRRSILGKQAGDIVEITYLKATKNSNIFTYSPVPIKVKVPLKGISYNLNTNKLQPTPQ